MKKEKTVQRIFDTNKRIRLGIWGLGRGMSFFNTCKLLNIDVVAGCDFNEHMRTNFLAACPGAFVTDNEEEFLKQDFDAVLLATFCPAHGPHAIKCLQAGKHVLSEVTSFFTMAEGVKLVEEVEKRKLVYNLAENYPFTAANMWLANRWKEGLFGDLMYAEYEYVHEGRSLVYTYADGNPVKPGHTVHNWRSWLNYHYYCTHSLGPVMVITGARPTLVEAFPCKLQIPGYPTQDRNGLCTMNPSLIQMSNGGVVRNLMGAATNDSHSQRIWGTLGAYEIGHDGLKMRLGGSGQSPMMTVIPQWEGLGELAAQTGHGGGDFWTLYYFAREIFTGEKGPFDIYGAADVTIPGIQALRSSTEEGKPMEVPDFRKKANRDRYRSDNWQQKRYNVKRGVFGGFVPAETDKASEFSTIMKAITVYATICRAYTDWKKVQSSLVNPEAFLPVAEKLLNSYDKLLPVYKDARQIVDEHPKTDGGRVLREMLELGEEEKMLAPRFLSALKKEVASLKRKFGSDFEVILKLLSSALLAEKTPIAKVGYPDKKIALAAIEYNAQYGFHDVRPLYNGKPKDGLLFIKGSYAAKKAGAGTLRIGADGPYKVFVNHKETGCNPTAINPISSHLTTLDVEWKKGENEIILAMRTNGGMAWGLTASALLK